MSTTEHPYHSQGARRDRAATLAVLTRIAAALEAIVATLGEARDEAGRIASTLDEALDLAGDAAEHATRNDASLADIAGATNILAARAIDPHAIIDPNWTDDPDDTSTDHEGAQE